LGASKDEARRIAANIAKLPNMLSAKAISRIVTNDAAFQPP
jgi:hypothetical protein